MFENSASSPEISKPLAMKLHHYCI